MDSVSAATSERLDERVRTILSDISTERMHQELDWFDRHGLRLGGTDGERVAARHIAQVLSDGGIEHTMEEFDALVSYAPQPESFGPAAVEIRAPTADHLAAKIYAFSASTGSAGVEADLVWVDRGTPDDYASLGADAHGRIVLSRLNFDAPHAEPARVAQERGALGLIIMNWTDADGPHVHTGTAKWGWGNPTPSDDQGMPRIPVVAIAHRQGLRLLEMMRGGRTRVAIVAQASREWVRAIQPIAHIQGASDDFVLFHGHLDSFGAGVTDNATGVVGLIELARVLHKHRDRLGRSVRIAWWACHEMPYAGSTWHLDRDWDSYRAHCVAAFNADAWALSGSSGRLIPLGFRELQALERVALHDVLGVDTEPKDFGTKDADQSFWAMGIPSGLVIAPTPDFPEGPFLGSWFHSEFDTAEHVDEEALLQLVQVYAVLALRLSVSEVLPVSHVAVAEQFLSVLRELALRAPEALDLTSLISAAEALVTIAKRTERVQEAAASAQDINHALLQTARILNPVLYTVAGRYGQDPIAAGYLKRRLPGMQLALHGLTQSESNPFSRHLWLTAAVRERNRVSDAIAEATELYERLLVKLGLGESYGG